MKRIRRSSRLGERRAIPRFEEQDAPVDGEGGLEAPRLFVRPGQLVEEVPIVRGDLGVGATYKKSPNTFILFYILFFLND